MTGPSRVMNLVTFFGTLDFSKRDSLCFFSLYEEISIMLLIIGGPVRNFYTEEFGLTSAGLFSVTFEVFVFFFLSMGFVYGVGFS